MDDCIERIYASFNSNLILLSNRLSKQSETIILERKQCATVTVTSMKECTESSYKMNFAAALLCLSSSA